LIGQAIGRIANFINQELYGPPTDLPWGIKIEAAHRLAQFPVGQYPVETTRFHPTFAYEMLWNFAAAGFLLWLARRHKEDIKPGTIFAGWLMLAGLGRVWIEFFRPDQPKIGDTLISYSMVAAALMAVAGAILLMARYKAINLAFAEDWEDEYQITGQEQAQEEPVVEQMEVEPKKKKAAPAKKKAPTTSKIKSAVAKKAPASKTIRTTKPTTKKPATRTKKST
jgi:hypothetical protein